MAVIEADKAGGSNWEGGGAFWLRVPVGAQGTRLDWLCDDVWRDVEMAVIEVDKAGGSFYWIDVSNREKGSNWIVGSDWKTGVATWSRACGEGGGVCRWSWHAAQPVTDPVTFSDWV
eukprot:115998-Chlamydomonas_euryale.AAC.3